MIVMSVKISFNIDWQGFQDNLKISSKSRASKLSDEK